MKIAIVGSRGYADLEQVARYVKRLNSDDVLVSGGANGVDAAAEMAAKARGLETEIYPVNTVGLPTEPEERRREYGKRAFARNQKIVDACDKLVAFWDGKSKGTADALHRADRAGKRAIVLHPGDSLIGL